MKKNKMLITVLTVFIAFLYGCTTSSSDTERSVSNLNNYLDSVQGLTPTYTAAAWNELNNGYELRLQEAQGYASLTKEEKAQIEAGKVKFAALKKEYEQKINESHQHEMHDTKTALRNRLFGEGVVGSDMSFANVTGANLLSVYRNFVNTVADNRDSYSREDWDEIKVLYEALDTRKNTVEKDAPRGDNTKIAGLKIKFATIKAANRGGTKAKENQDAKDKAN